MNADATPQARSIHIRGARQHNLRDITIDIPRDKLVVITGLSGSGKSSLAFDTIYAEGRRKYVESLSVYARQFLEQMAKPDVDHIEGLPPTIAIEQRAGGGSPRSTVATTTEIYDYMRLLFARVGTPHCPRCGRKIGRQTTTQIVDAVLAMPDGTRVMILAPLVRGRTGEHRDVFRRILREGFVRVRVDGDLIEARNFPELSARRKHVIDVVIDRLILKPDVRTRLAESIAAGLHLADGLVIAAHQPPAGAGEDWTDLLFSTRFACTRCDYSLEELEPRMFSFNSPYGACPACDGLGRTLEFDAELLVPEPNRPLDDGAIAAWVGGGKGASAGYAKLLRDFCDRFDVAPSTPFALLQPRLRDALLHGAPAESGGEPFEGVIPNLKKRWETTDSEQLKNRLHSFLSESPCGACGGARLRPDSLAVRIAGRNIHEMSSLSIAAGFNALSDLSLPAGQNEIARPILKEIVERLRFLNDVGVGYLTLDRSSATLSGGEGQRIRLATQIGSGLVGVCYVLDEPTIGLHPRDNDRLIAALRRLRDLGNTVLVVEHDEDAIRAADWIIDVGPGAGAHGGRLIFEGPFDALMRSRESVTAQYLRGDLAVPRRTRHRKVTVSNVVQVLGARENNLQNIDVGFPLGVFCCVTGVSGSGKSTLVTQILLRALKRRLLGGGERPGAHDRIVGAARVDKVIEIDQTPIGRTPRSNPATYTGVFDLVRSLYAKTREAKVRGYDGGQFSFNVKGGRCEACQGQGTQRIEMHFLPDVYVTCPECKGSRYNRETLEVKFRGKSIADVLEMRAEEALAFFDSFSQIRQLLQALCDVGLGYVALGQASSTLSGGEAQRVKLAAELGKSPAGHTLYILDEPTTGLHFADIHKLLNVLNRLCDLGHTILVIEHNLDVIAQADWIIDLGPEGGEAGGRLVAQGTPEQVAEIAESYTGKYVRKKSEGK